MEQNALAQQYDACASYCLGIFENKLKDYGPNWLLYRPSSLADEIWRKAKRIRSLEELKDACQVDEGRDVEYVGIINYSIIMLIVLAELEFLPRPQEALENLALLEAIPHPRLVETYRQMMGQARDLILRKNHDYSNTWRSMELSSLTDQILIKTYRIKNILRQNHTLLVSEGVDAQLHDIINYAFFALVRMDAEAVRATAPEEGSHPVENHMVIRQETSRDHDGVYRLVKAAFETAEHSDGTEHDLVAALRKSSAFVPELSLVAEIGGQLAGHILFSQGKVGSDTVLVLAPLSVSPAFQKQGVGSALMGEGHRIAGEMGYSHCLVLGSETYYPRAGYLPAVELGIEVPDGIPPANFMARKLRGNAGPIRGAVTYAKEFGM